LSKPKSKTTNYSGISDALSGTKTYKTKISDGKKSVSALGSPKTSQKRASDKWNKKK